MGLVLSLEEKEAYQMSPFIAALLLEAAELLGVIGK
jgi:hypothetical protein